MRRQIVFRRWISLSSIGASMFVGVVMVSLANAEPPSSDTPATIAATEPTEACRIWGQFASANEVWLNPRPQRLSYVVFASPKNDDGRIASNRNRVWIDGGKLRWEMESGNRSIDGVQRSTDVMVCVDGKLAYLFPPKDDLLNKSLPIQELLPTRQGIRWYSVVHALYHEGFPEDAVIVDRHAVLGGEVVVLEMNLPRSRGSVGLGLHHSFLGQANTRFDRVRLHLRTPECTPVKEEWLDHNSEIEYGACDLLFGDKQAPREIRYVGELADGKPWVLDCRFQNVQGNWLLDSAQNLHDGRVVTQMSISEASVTEIAPTHFESSKESGANQ